MFLFQFLAPISGSLARDYAWNLYEDEQVVETSESPALDVSQI